MVIVSNIIDHGVLPQLKKEMKLLRAVIVFQENLMLKINQVGKVWIIRIIVLDRIQLLGLVVIQEICQDSQISLSVIVIEK